MSNVPRIGLSLLSALSILLTLIVLMGGPTALYYTYHEHHGSIAYHHGDKSWLDEDNHHARVCDNTLLVNAYTIVEVKGPNIKVVDKNGRNPGCGDLRFTREGKGHKTCEYKGCGAWSIH